MAENSRIEWTTHTMNPWRGCSPVSPGCDHCYAEAMSLRNPAVLGVWGKEGTRVVAAEAQWRAPLRWNEEAKAAGERRRVFCASLADVFEGEDTMPADSVRLVLSARMRLMRLIGATPDLDWLLLTKRPENAVPILGDLAGLGGDPAFDFLRGWISWSDAPPNVWLGTTAEDQRRADDRIPHLLRIPAVVRFLSVEPMLGPVDLTAHLATGGIHWVIVGGESGHRARPFHLDWADEIVGACRMHGVACFVKQLGARPVMETQPLKLKAKKGGEIEDFPVNLRVREFPRVGHRPSPSGG